MGLGTKSAALHPLLQSGKGDVGRCSGGGPPGGGWTKMGCLSFAVAGMGRGDTFVRRASISAAVGDDMLQGVISCPEDMTMPCSPILKLGIPHWLVTGLAEKMDPSREPLNDSKTLNVTRSPCEKLSTRASTTISFPSNTRSTTVASRSGGTQSHDQALAEASSDVTTINAVFESLRLARQRIEPMEVCMRPNCSVLMGIAVCRQRG